MTSVVYGHRQKRDSEEDIIYVTELKIVGKEREDGPNEDGLTR